MYALIPDIYAQVSVYPRNGRVIDNLWIQANEMIQELVECMCVLDKNSGMYYCEARNGGKK